MSEKFDPRNTSNGRVTPTESDLLDAVAKYARAFLETPRPVRPRAPDRLDHLLGGALPRAGNTQLTTLRLLIEAGETGLMPSGDSRSFGYVIGGALPIGIASDWLVSLWDQCAAVYETSPLASVAEEVCERWLTDLFALPRDTAIGLTSGCTTANLACLAAARQEQFHAVGWDVNERGMDRSPPLTVLVGEHTHVSVLRCLRLLGLGGQVVRVHAGNDGRMDVHHLSELVARMTGGLIVCGQVGSTDCGSVDPLSEIAGLTRAHGGWLHLDAAFGMWAAASPALRPLLQGLELADSWACDGHKWLNTPHDCGIALCAHPAPLREAVRFNADYLQTTERTGRDPMDHRVEISQRARALTLWAVLHHEGSQGIAAVIERNCTAARTLGRLLEPETDIDLLAPVTLNQVLLHIGDEQHIRAVVDSLNSSGTCWVTPTTWTGQAAVRISVTNWQSGRESAEATAAAFLRAHREAHT
ncbi:pyridoxal phosphate-dependent decarboxylase family protein [Streptomyces pinistramenti]|uniref:pyridoxal phosphate-dependent decarboxylase family protein n=1 Tax=Streptomyces pinistramenti TaxID=2884812 RepID=UPI001D0933A6|nr:pyridoxal-dependent decarboxylase [Streptomyces pinistramenti]MCB5912192.1 aspartate aminotransferase family protein [Streptomyces pinistramenti]